MAGVRLIIQFTTNSAQEADSQIQAMAERCRAAQQEPGCLQFEVFRSALRPEQYALLEHWASEEALEQHRQHMTPGPATPNVQRVRESYQHKTD